MEVEVDLQTRVRELAEAAGIDIESERIRDDRCWVDGRVRCPYGAPEGQYVLRPEIFCNSKCQTFAVNDVRVCCEEEFDEGVSERISTAFDAKKVTVSSELRVQGEKLADGCPERLALELAADILDEHASVKNRNVLIEDDIPG